MDLSLSLPCLSPSFCQLEKRQHEVWACGLSNIWGFWPRKFGRKPSHPRNAVQKKLITICKSRYIGLMDLSFSSYSTTDRNPRTCLVLVDFRSSCCEEIIFLDIALINMHYQLPFHIEKSTLCYEQGGVARQCIPLQYKSLALKC